MTDADYKKYCCKSTTGRATWNGSNNMCCRAASAECCDVNQAYCTCPQKYARYSSGYWGRTKNAYTSEAAEGCCTGPSRITGSDWVAGCCSVKYYASGNGSNEGKDCCRILYNNATARNSVFSVGAGCCSILGVNSETGKDSTGAYYPECQLTCFKESIYSTSTKYTPSSVAKDCCAGSGKGLVQTASNWQKYCCGMINSEHSWSFPMSGSNGSCCEKRKTSNTGVYVYDPYYIDHACPAGGEKNACSAYGYAAFGFVCQNDDKCSAWKSFPNDVSLSDSEKQSCCYGSDHPQCKPSCEVAGAWGEMNCWRSGENFICEAKGYSPAGAFPLFVNGGQYSYGFPTNSPTSYAAQQSRAIPKDYTSVPVGVFYPSNNAPTGTVSASGLNTCYGFTAKFSVSNSCVLSGSITSNSQGDGCKKACTNTSSFTLNCSGTYTNNSAYYPNILGTFVHCQATGCPSVENSYTPYVGKSVWGAVFYTKSELSNGSYLYESGSYALTDGDTQDWDWRGTWNGAAIQKCQIVQGNKGSGQTLKTVQADCDGGPCTNGKTPNHCSISYP